MIVILLIVVSVLAIYCYALLHFIVKVDVPLSLGDCSPDDEAEGRALGGLVIAPPSGAIGLEELARSETARSSNGRVPILL
jgi:hypothetical protein